MDEFETLEPEQIRTMSLTVSVGRNVGDEPLPEDRWHTFTAEVVQYVEAYLLAVDGELTVRGNYGEGYWEADGKRTDEDNFVVQGIWPMAVLIPVEHPDPQAAALEKYEQVMRAGYMLQHNLAHTAHEYGQETIGFAVGEMQLLVAHPSGWNEGYIEEGVEAIDAFLAEQDHDWLPPRPEHWAPTPAGQRPLPPPK